MLIKDDWLSQYFGKDVFHLKIVDEPPFGLEGIFELPSKSFIYAKVPIEKLEPLQLLTEANFRLVETQVIWQQQDLTKVNQSFQCLQKINPELELRFSKESDLLGIKTIAQDAFQHSRFYKDENISKDTASKIKTDWVTNFFKGQRGDNMIVATLKGEVVGFLMAIKNSIDLIGVSKNHYRQNIGSKLISFANKEIGLLKAGTQLSNYASAKLYQKTGFNIHSANYVLHKHL